MNEPNPSTMLAPLVQQFFTERLMAQRNASPRTIAAYRDAFRLLLAWYDRKLHKPSAQLVLTDLNVTRIAAFLDYLETERHNTIRSRNARFAALRSFLGFAARKEPGDLGTIQGVLALPMKRCVRCSVTSRERRSRRCSMRRMGTLGAVSATARCWRRSTIPAHGFRS